MMPERYRNSMATPKDGHNTKHRHRRDRRHEQGFSSCSLGARKVGAMVVRKRVMTLIGIIVVSVGALGFRSKLSLHHQGITVYPTQPKQISGIRSGSHHWHRQCQDSPTTPPLRHTSKEGSHHHHNVCLSESRLRDPPFRPVGPTSKSLHQQDIRHDHHKTKGRW